LDENFATGEFRLQLHGWTTERRFVVLRERVREDDQQQSGMFSYSGWERR